MRLLLVAAGLLLAACPPGPHVDVDAGPDENDAGPAGAVDPTQYCESIVDFFCDFYVRCGRMAVGNADDCKPVFLEACNGASSPPSSRSPTRGC